MRNILIILSFAVALAAAGFFGTLEIVHRRQLAEEQKLERPTTGESLRDQAEYERRSNLALADMATRQTAAMIGGGGGLAAGMLLGVGIAVKTCRKCKAPGA